MDARLKFCAVLSGISHGRTEVKNLNLREVTFMRFMLQENGQAMVEYVIVSAAIVAGVLAFNELVIPQIVFLYKFIGSIVSMPFP